MTDRRELTHTQTRPDRRVIRECVSSTCKAERVDLSTCSPSCLLPGSHPAPRTGCPATHPPCPRQSLPSGAETPLPAALPPTPCAAAGRAVACACAEAWRGGAPTGHASTPGYWGGTDRLSVTHTTQRRTVVHIVVVHINQEEQVCV